MILFHRLLLKFDTLYRKMIERSYLKACLARGLQLAEGVILIEAPDFGSEPYLVSIGKNTQITAGCRFITHDGGLYVVQNMTDYADVRNFGRIQIGENCFLGNNCILLPGAKMGDNCVLGAGSVLNSTMPDNTVYAGIPAKFISTIEEYGAKALNSNIIYPRELENNRAALDGHLQQHVPYDFKPVREHTRL